MEEIQMCQIKFHLTFFIVGVLFILGPKELLADCVWKGPFLENIELANLIVRGKVLTSNENTSTPSPSLEIEVLEVYKGTFANSKLQLAYAPVSGIFIVGTEWILAVKQKPSGDYIIPNCWTSYLRVKSSVKGSLNNTTERYAKQRIGLDEFQNLLQGEDPSLLLSGYEDGVQAGLQQCNASYEPKNGRLYIPAVRVLLNESRQLITYEAMLIQRLPFFIFDLDLDSVKAYRQ
jgi:hypothetical protein